MIGDPLLIDHYGRHKREGWRRRGRNLVTFFLNRLSRGSPRILLVLALCVVILGTFTIPRTLFEMLFSKRHMKYLSWPAWRQNSNYGQEGGGLRVMVFGSPDVATPVTIFGNQVAAKSWTEVLCEQLKCSQYQSFVRRLDTTHSSYSLTSNKVYQAMLHTLATGITPNIPPGQNYTFLLDQFPVPEHEDLVEQVSRFLRQPAPEHPSKETLWVFSFGTWDIWNIAAFPRVVGKTIIDSMVFHLFSQIERLYMSSMDETSPAFSDFWGYSDDDIFRKLLRRTLVENSRRETETFRVLIPRVFDVTVLPGWTALRPAPPAPHSTAEQMRNAAFLANRWNKAIEDHVGRWNKLPPPDSPELHDLSKYVSTRLADEESAKASPTSIGRRAPGFSSLPPVVYAPYPRRLGVVHDGVEFVMDAIVEKQMRLSNFTDGKGLGARPANSSVHFHEVAKPCLTLPHLESSETPNEDGRLAAAAAPLFCERPQDHLFTTPLTVNERAIQEIGTLAYQVSRDKLLLGEEEPVQPVPEPSKEEKRGKIQGSNSTADTDRALKPRGLGPDELRPSRPKPTEHSKGPGPRGSKLRGLGGHEPTEPASRAHERSRRAVPTPNHRHG